MIQHREGQGDTAGSEGPDPVLGGALRAVDPGTRDPTYWFRFRSRVLASAAHELARRRMMVDLTVSDLVVSWARALVPTAMIAAAVAALVLAQGVPGSAVLPLGLEEELAQGLDGMPIPVVLTSDDQPDAGGVVFASEAY